MNKHEARWVLERAHEQVEFPSSWLDAVDALLLDVANEDENFVAGFLACMMERLPLEQVGMLSSLLLSDGDSNSRRARIVWTSLAFCSLNEDAPKCLTVLENLATDPHLDEPNVEMLRDAIRASQLRSPVLLGDTFMLNSSEILDLLEGMFACSGNPDLIESLVVEAVRFNKGAIAEFGVEAFERAKLCRAILAKLAIRHPAVWAALENDARAQDLVRSIKSRS
jgi:hypothetical protein